MRYCGEVLSVMTMVWLLCANPAEALTMEPPMPADCRAAEKAQGLQSKVDLYTNCLDRRLSSERKMEDWQRNNVYLNRADALFEMGRYAEAIADYDRYLANSSYNVWALGQRGLAHVAMGQRQKAVADFDAALKINPDALEVRYNRGMALAGQGLYQSALEDLRRSASEAPNVPKYANTLAWLLSTCPDKGFIDGKQAVKFARKAVSQDRNAVYLDTLAAAYARTGNFQLAITAQKEALALLRDSHASPGTIEQLSSRLDLYSKGKPYTEDRPEQP